MDDSLEKDCPSSCQFIGGPTDVAECYRDESSRHIPTRWQTGILYDRLHFVEISDFFSVHRTKSAWQVAGNKTYTL